VTVKLTHTNERTIRSILQTYRSKLSRPCHRTQLTQSTQLRCHDQRRCNFSFRYSHDKADVQITEDEFIDVLLGTRKYIPALTAINKIDGVSMETLDQLAREGDGRTVMLSCELDLGIDWLLEAIWRVSQLLSFLKQGTS
jgi:ribosome-interacting GTPase 1